ncbi:MAG: T9SS type A sorting domain-containing protein [Candidatus Hatepunaea meridiana]|nr:T9SS type A sorting domain-containing protein [Candidatus Hatepunaea meridiana]
MTRKVLLMLLMALFIVGPLFARPANKVDPLHDVRVHDLKTLKNIGPDFKNVINANSDRTFDGTLDRKPERDDADAIEAEGNVEIGDDFLIGYTWYDYQHNGSISKMIVRDEYGGVQFAWMKGGDSQNRDRHVVYNYLHPPDEDGELLAEPGEAGTADNADKSGYCMLAVVPSGRENPGQNDLGCVIYHAMGYPNAPDDAYVSTAQGVDFERAFGAFESTYPPAWPNSQLIWPKGAIDRNNYSHTFACEYFGEGDNLPIYHRLGYWRGEPDDDFAGWDWYEVPIIVDTSAVISQVVAASPTSDKVVLGWHHSRIGIPTGAWVENGGLYQRNSTIQYIVSNDGEAWDWDNGVRELTNILPVIPDLWDIDREEAYGDTFRPYCDLDIQFDPWGNDELFATFATNVFWEYPRPDDNGSPAAATGEHGYLWFWSSREDTISMIFDGYYFNRRLQGGGGTRCGGWRMNADRGSIAFNPDDAGTVYVVWCNFPKIMVDVREDNGEFIRWDFLEGATDTSGLGYSSAEIMVSISTDYGITWQEPTNITQTRWMEDEAPEEGECMSENWPSVAYVADDTLHIMYILDLEAGGWPQEEGETSDNPVIYHRVALVDLEHDGDPVELPHEDFQFHNYLDFRPYVQDPIREPGVPVTDAEVHVRATVMPGGDQDLTEVNLLFRIDEGEEQSVEMEHIDGDTYAGTIPGQEEGSNIWYRIHAVNDEDFEVYEPATWYWSYVVQAEGGLTIDDVQRHNRNWGIDYSPYRGYEVTVSGIVTCPASFNSEYGAYTIQDGVGDWSAIFVRGIEDSLGEGNIIEVTGTVMERDPDDPDKWKYATYIDVDDYSVTGQGEKPAPTYTELAELVIAERAEQLEAVYVEIRNFEIKAIDWNAFNLGFFEITCENGDGWFTTNGLTDDVIQERELLFDEDPDIGIRQGTSFEWMKGVLVESYGVYGIAPTQPDEVGPLAVLEDGTPSPYRFSLAQPYPNPFNSTTKIGFEISKPGWTRLALYDVTGREVAMIVQGDLSAGNYNFTIDASSLSTGVYIMRLDAGERTISRKLVLMK